MRFITCAIPETGSINRQSSAAARTVALANRFGVSDRAPTAVALARLVDLLKKCAPEVVFRMVATERTYGGGGAAGENILRRIAASWRDGANMARAAAECSAVLSLTDPPFLGARLARRLPAQSLWIEWAMDLYPAALWAASGLRPRWSPRLLRRHPDLRLFLGPAQAAFAAGLEKWRGERLILPAGVNDPPPISPGFAEPVEPPETAGPVRLAYAGNLGRAHWSEALPLLAAAADPARFRLIIAAYGVKAMEVRRRLAAFPHVEWRDRPLNQAELDAAHVHIASLKENWTHVCVPSKAISALSRGRPVLFFGAAESDVWRWADGGGLRLDPDRAAAVSALPGALAQLAASNRLAALTRRARAAGERLRAAEAAAVAELAARLEAFMVEQGLLNWPARR